MPAEAHTTTPALVRVFRTSAVFSSAAELLSEKPAGEPRLRLMTSAPRRAASSMAARISDHWPARLAPNTFMMISWAAGATPEKVTLLSPSTM